MDWDALFGTVSRIVLQAADVATGMNQLAAWASKREPYAGFSVWEEIPRQDWTQTRETVATWLKDSLAQLPKVQADALLLELGDCPELFEVRTLRLSGEHGGIVGLRKALRKHPPVHSDNLPQIDWFGGKQKTLGRQHFNYQIPGKFWQEIYYRNTEVEPCSTECGYAVWLCLALLITSETLRSTRIELSPRQASGHSIPLLAGYEEIFMGFGELTAGAWQPPGTAA